MSVTRVRAHQLRLDGSGGLESQADGDLAIKLNGASLALSASGLIVNGLRTVAGDPGSPANGDTWYDSTNTVPKLRAAGVTQRLVGTVYANTANSSSVTNTTTETTFDVNYTFPANFFTAGKAIRLFYQAVYQGNLTASPSFLTKLGGVTLGSSAPVINEAATNLRGSVLMELVCRTTGATGTFGRSGFVGFEQALGGSDTLFGASGGTAVVVDTTATLQLAVTVTWSAASVNNIAFLHQFIVEVLN